MGWHDVLQLLNVLIIPALAYMNSINGRLNRVEAKLEVVMKKLFAK